MNALDSVTANYILLFARMIEHGDEEHRQWLRNAAKSFIENGTVPPVKCPCETTNDISELCHRCEGLGCELCEGTGDWAVYLKGSTP